MDILNWVYLLKNKLVKTTVQDPTQDLVILGGNVTYAKRGDKYQSYGMTVEDFINSTATTLGVESGTYVPTITTGGGPEVISSIKGFYTKVGNIVNVTVFFLFSGGGGSKDFEISIPIVHDPIGGGGFTDDGQASGVFMRYDNSPPAANTTENKVVAYVGLEAIRLQYNGGDTGDGISCIFTYEVLPS